MEEWEWVTFKEAKERGAPRVSRSSKYAATFHGPNGDFSYFCQMKKEEFNSEEALLECVYDTITHENLHALGLGHDVIYRLVPEKHQASWHKVRMIQMEEGQWQATPENWHGQRLWVGFWKRQLLAWKRLDYLQKIRW